MQFITIAPEQDEALEEATSKLADTLTDIKQDLLIKKKIISISTKSDFKFYKDELTEEIEFIESVEEKLRALYFVRQEWDENRNNLLSEIVDDSNE